MNVCKLKNVNMRQGSIVKLYFNVDSIVEWLTMLYPISNFDFKSSTPIARVLIDILNFLSQILFQMIRHSLIANSL